MSICLVTRGESVAFYDGETTRLFQRGHVYKTRTGAEFPRGKKTWCFIDCDYGGNIPVYIGSRISAAYPVQASSPNPTQYKAWVKQRFATILGMQLWSEDGIVKGCAPVLL